MARYWQAEGVVEALGNSEVRQAATIYSVVKLRLPNGQVEAFSNLGFARMTHTEIRMGAHLGLLGVTQGSRSACYAVVELPALEVASDIRELGRDRLSFRNASRPLLWVVGLGLALSIALLGFAFTVILLPLLAVMLLAVAVHRTLVWVPDRQEMEERLQAFLASHRRDVAKAA